MDAEVKLCRNCNHELEKETSYTTHKSLSIEKGCLVKGCDCEQPEA